MSSDAESPTPTLSDVTAARFDRDGETVYNLALRITDSPGAAWHATVAAFAAVAERVPADAPPGTDSQDLLLMGCWHGRQLLTQLEAHPEYAAQLRAHDAANVPMASLQASVVKANRQLPVDQREILALRGLSRLDHDDLAVLLRADPGVLAAMLAQARLMLRDAMRGSSIAAEALSTPEARQAIALAALRQDGQLRGTEARLTLARWLEGGDERRSVVDALEEAGLSYRAWTRTSPPEGLREAVVAGVADVAAPAPAAPAPEPTAAAPTAQAAEPTGAAPVEPTPVEAPIADPSPADAPPVEPAAPAEPAEPAAAPEPTSGPEPPTEQQPLPAAGEAPAGPGLDEHGRPVDPDATVEWSAGDLAELGLHPTDEDERSEDAWDGEEWDDDEGPLVAERLQPIAPGRRAPRWQVLVVAVLLIAVLIVLALTFLGGDDSTPTSALPALHAALGDGPGTILVASR